MASEDIRPIQFAYEGKSYTLEFDRASALTAERAYNISLADLGAFKLSTLHDLFAAAFVKNHPKVKASRINEMFNRMTNKPDLYQSLVKLYAEVANSVLEDPDEGNGISWTTG